MDLRRRGRMEGFNLVFHLQCVSANRVDYLYVA